MVEQEGGCIAWGGSVSLSPTDDIVIRVERALDLDSEGQLVASVISKKVAAGATHVLIDMPVGPTAKVRQEDMARRLTAQLVETGAALGLQVSVLQTDGTQPVGRGIGPALEARDILQVLRREAGAPRDLRARALTLAGALLELGGAAAPGEGLARATATLDSGAAWQKFRAICAAQGGMREPPLSRYQHPVVARRSGVRRAPQHAQPRQGRQARRRAGRPGRRHRDARAPRRGGRARAAALHHARRHPGRVALRARLPEVAPRDAEPRGSGTVKMHLDLRRDALGDAVAARLGWPRVDHELRPFPDGESYIRMLSDVDAAEVTVLADLARPNARVLELLLVAATLRAQGARRVVLVAPYLPYMRQDRALQARRIGELTPFRGAARCAFRCAADRGRAPAPLRDAERALRNAGAQPHGRGSAGAMGASACRCAAAGRPRQRERAMGVGGGARTGLPLAGAGEGSQRRPPRARAGAHRPGASRAHAGAAR